MRVAVLLLSMLISAAAWAIHPADALQESKKMVEARRYADAFKYLDSADKKNANADIVLAKLDLALNYYATSVMHRFFGFVNLKEGEVLDSLRGKPGKYDLYVFPANEILDSMVRAQPEDFRLHKALGEYYYEVYLRYGEDWLMPIEEVMIKMEQHFTQAVLGNVADYETHFVMGFLKMGAEQWQDAIGYLNQSIQMNPLYPAAYYNMAYAQLQNGQGGQALKYAQIAWQLYEDDAMKPDVARMLSLLFDENYVVDSAIYYLRKGLEIDPGNYQLLKDYLDVATREKMPERDSVLLEFYLLAPDKPTVYNTIGDIFYAHNVDPQFLIAFYSDMMPVFKDYDIIQGNLHFFIGQLQFEQNRVAALQSFTKARQYFLKVYEPGNIVFDVINQYLTFED